MSEPTLNYVHCPDTAGGHRMAYWQWGDSQATHVVLCVHGLSRQGRDFDVLAQALVGQSGGTVQVICPDVVGRGQSDWLKDPSGYQLPTYAADILTLIGVLQPTTLDWVGTSMGGLIGMAICGQQNLPMPVPVRRLVLNDVGPALEWQAIVRIGSYLGREMEFPSLEDAAEAMWRISSSFGPHSPEQWLALSRPMVKQVVPGESTVVLHYDPAIALPLRAMTQEAASQGELMMWHLYGAITAKVLLLRGAESDLLSPNTAQRMATSGPHARLVEFAGVGHAPTLIAPDQLAVVTSFLLAADA